ncbi:hypothetical protein HPP92_007912 [Vanilla planifolia]|uniref:Histone acetyltransferase n=1 Tax=Vanilla planifolia TaxID=51239 RepID=A0A835V853_VANPL|nr:hypothetical protein HPP92_007912 [Vanilla planifolia]
MPRFLPRSVASRQRLANEIHCSATRKNKEWQEKLPFVVLKAEEIMYSKANSEAEYMDLTTLWERVNDAIDTIIRKDDANESADFLQPCIEAALNLGCVPRRASRSQRHSNPVFYLSPKLKEAADVSLKPKDNEDILQVGSTSMPPLQPKQSINLQGSVNQCRVKYSGLEPEVRGSSMPLESCFWSSLGRVYPLYYGECHSKSDSQELIGKKVIYDPTKPSLQTYGALDPDFSMVDVLNKVSGHCMASKLKPNTGYDLSLRLGLPSLLSSDVENAWTHEVDDWGSSSSCDGGDSCGPLPCRPRTMNLDSSLSSAQQKGFDFFCLDANDEPQESCLSKWSLDADCAIFMSACSRH